MSRAWSQRLRPRLHAWGLAAACTIAATTAHANCTSPAAAEGSLNYDTSSHTFQYCDNTSTWQSLASGAGGGATTDHIISGTTNVYVNSNTATISFTTNGSVANYFNSSGVLVTTGISVTTNQLSATTGYFTQAIKSSLSYTPSLIDGGGQSLGFGFTNNGPAFFRYSTAIASFNLGASVGGVDTLNLGTNALGFNTSNLSQADPLLYRNGAAVLRTNSDLIVDGKVGIKTITPTA